MKYAVNKPVTRTDKSSAGSLANNIRAWSLYIDLLENCGEFEDTKWAYERIIEAKIATAETILNFTGFLQRSDGGKAEFWQKHGQNYVAKVHLEMEKTEDHAQRYNLKRRLEQVFEERPQLAMWRNILVKENGFIY